MLVHMAPIEVPFTVLGSCVGEAPCAPTDVPPALNAFGTYVCIMRSNYAFGTKCVSCGPTRVCACCPHRPANLQSTLFNSLVENGKAQVRWCRSGAAQEYGCCICRCGGASQGLGRSRGITCRGEVLHVRGWAEVGHHMHGRGGVGQGLGEFAGTGEVV